MKHKILETTYKWLETSGVPQAEQYKLGIKLIKEELAEIEEELHKDTIDVPRLMAEIVDCMWVLSNMVYFFDAKEEFYKQAKLIEKKNFSKFCRTEGEAKRSIELYAAGLHPQKRGVKIDDLTYEKVGEYYVIKRNDGKVMKSFKTIN